MSETIARALLEHVIAELDECGEATVTLKPGASTGSAAAEAAALRYAAAIGWAHANTEDEWERARDTIERGSGLPVQEGAYMRRRIIRYRLTGEGCAEAQRIAEAGGPAWEDEETAYAYSGPGALVSGGRVLAPSRVEWGAEVFANA